jgi:hypothetical protein
MNFYKPILLPSNNIVYNSVIEIKEIDVAFLIQLRASFLNSSETELTYALIKQYTNIKEPKKLFYKDIQYIYYLYLTMLNKTDELKVPNVCNNCNDKVNIKINLSKFQTKYATKEDFTDRSFSVKDFNFFFRNRLFKDNIISGIINFENEKSNINNVINFLKPQCTKIIYNNTETYDNSYLEDAFLEIGLDNIIKIFDDLREESWGIDSSFFYECKKCGSNNKAFISDPYRSSFYFFEKDSSFDSELLELLVQLSSFKMLTYSELLSTPLSIWDILVKQMTDVIKKKYGGKNSSGYLEQFQEEIG